MLLLIGLIIGLLLGLTGAGGSVFAVPLLIMVGKVSMGDAIGISLGAVAASALYGSLRNLQRNTILWMPSFILAIGGAFTAPLGKWLGMQVSELWLLLGFNLLATIIAVRMWLGAIRNPENAAVVRATYFKGEPTQGLLCNLSQTGQFELRPSCVGGLLIGGLLVGLLSGLFGVGGGFLVVPLLLALSPISIVQAVSTSLVVIAVVSGSGFVSHLALNTNHSWPTLGLVSAGGILGMMLGQSVSHKIANALLQKIFAVGLILVSVSTLALHH